MLFLYQTGWELTTRKLRLFLEATSKSINDDMTIEFVSQKCWEDMFEPLNTEFRLILFDSGFGSFKSWSRNTLAKGFLYFIKKLIQKTNMRIAFK